ncbi:MAG: glycosyltransferase family 8 protein [Oscillospiraceae bacterium]|nr:glycosyltransferase family 8 protein [Oscillospiraceae bacterium]
MNIVYVFDNLYAEVTGISILSLFENNKDADEINVYAVCDSVTDINKQRLTGISESYGRKIIFLDAPDVEKIVGTAIEIDNHWSLATYYRLFISSLLPHDMKKIIYIDGDTTIQSSLSELWGMEQGKNVISGVRARRFPYHSRNQKIFLKSDDIYINAGVMLINLDLWRHYGVEEKFIKFMKLMDGNTRFKDQCIINSVLNGYIGTIDPAYNYWHFHINSEREIHPKDLKRVREITQNNNQVIVHYLRIQQKIDKAESGLDAPDILYFRNDWYKWREMSPWGGLPLEHLRSPHQKPAPPPPLPAKRKTIRRQILRFTEKNCKPLFVLLNNIGIYFAAFLRSSRNFFTDKIFAFSESARIRKYNKHRQKVTGINIKDCRIEMHPKS